MRTILFGQKDRQHVRILGSYKNLIFPLAPFNPDVKVKVVMVKQKFFRLEKPMFFLFDVCNNKVM